LIPVLGYLFGTRSNNATQTEIVLSLTPRMVGHRQLPEARNMEFWTGSETSLRSEPLSLRQIGAVTVAPGAGPTTPGGQQPPSPGFQQGAPVPPPPGAQPPAGPVPAPKVAPQPQGAGQPISFMWQGPNAAKVGTRFTVTLNAQASEPLQGIGLIVNYDASVLRAIEAAEGSLLRQGGAQPAFKRDIDQGSGEINLDVSRNAGSGAKGSGSIASITFEVVAAAPQTQISVSRVAPAAANGEPLPFTPPGAHALTLNP
jgi:general secretion pathway protein D